MYQRIGTYRGTRPIAELVEIALALPFTPNSAGYEDTGGNTKLLHHHFSPWLGEPFIGEWEFAMVVKLPQLAQLPVHADEIVVPSTRYHLVLQTNPRAWYYHDGEWEQLETGGIYTLDPTLEHGAINWGVTPRVHLVVDIKES